MVRGVCWLLLCINSFALQRHAPSTHFDVVRHLRAPEYHRIVFVLQSESQRVPISITVFSLLSGILPFGIVSFELVFTLRSIYQNHLFYLFRFVGIVFLVLFGTCAEVSVFLTYLQLSKESYHFPLYRFLRHLSLCVQSLLTILAK